MPKDKKELRAAMRLVVYMDHLMRLFETPFVLRTNRGDSSFGTESGGYGAPLVLCLTLAALSSRLWQVRLKSPYRTSLASRQSFRSGC